MGTLATLSILVLVQAIRANFPDLRKTPFTDEPLNDLGDPLILTPFIEANQIKEARAAALVDSDRFGTTTSYSGYFTVDETDNANLFFWYFPSANDYKTDPVVVWLQGGPGDSSLFGLFTENGPFSIDRDSVVPRTTSWHKNHSMIYIDQPIGTGYSFTEGELVTDQTRIGIHLYSALMQFFLVFPELKSNDFYIAGESYAGKYVPALGRTIHEANQDPDALFEINLRGLIIGNGLSDPRHQFNYGDLLYQLGLIDQNALVTMDNMESVSIAAMDAGNYELATAFWSQILSLFTTYTGLENVYNYLEDVDNEETDWQLFVVSEEIRRAIHVGNRSYSDQNNDVYNALYDDITKSVAPWIRELLDHYRFLIYNGQLDVIVGYALTANYLQNLEFSAADEYANAERNIWMVDGRVAGYVKVAGNLTEALVRDAGHMVPADQPEFAYDLIYKFIRNIPIGSK